jgi:hypothetical protein
MRPGPLWEEEGEAVPPGLDGLQVCILMSPGWGAGIRDGKVETAGDFEETMAAILETIRRTQAIEGPRTETRPGTPLPLQEGERERVPGGFAS